MENEIVVSESISLGVIRASDPNDVIKRATAIAKALAKVIEDQKLFSVISGRKFVRVEGWSTLGAMLGVLPREVSVERLEDGGYLAVVELIRTTDCAVVGRGSAICGMDEKTWGNRPEYARRSMAITRATGKAYRLGFSWIVTLAGFEATPAEEMGDDVIEGHVREAAPVTTKAPVKSSFPAPSQPMSLETAQNVTTSEGLRYGDQDRKMLVNILNGIDRALGKNGLDDARKEELTFKRDATLTLLNQEA